MKEKKLLALLVIFFLAQGIVSSPILSFENNPLNPPTNIDANYSDPVVKNIYDAICQGVLLYELDTAKRLSRKEIERSYPGLMLNPGVRFDLANMGLGRKGWTRYYPFSISGKSFIMRIFLTAEKAYQPSVPVLYEGSIANPAVTFQVLPSLNEILSDCKIKPIILNRNSPVSRSP